MGSKGSLAARDSGVLDTQPLSRTAEANASAAPNLPMPDPRAPFRRGDVAISTGRRFPWGQDGTFRGRFQRAGSHAKTLPEIRHALGSPRNRFAPERHFRK